jgi:hypothetical protein
MSTTTYLSTNNLPCKYWLDASNTASFTINSVSFEWRDRYLTTKPIFRTTDFNNLPTRVNNLVDIPLNASLVSTLVIPGLSTSYTVIYLSRNPTVLAQEQIIDIGDFNLKYQDSSLLFDYSRLGIDGKNIQSTDYVLAEAPLIAFSHDTRAKKFDVYQISGNNVNLNTLAYEKGITLNSALHRLQGPNLNISHVLFFSPAINSTHIQNIINSLIAETPILATNLVWDNITTNAWDTITTALWEGIK